MRDPQRIAGSDLGAPLPTDRLVEQGQQLLGLLAERAIERAVESVEGLAQRLIDHAQHGGPGLLAAITGRVGAGATASRRGSGRAGVAGVSESVERAFAGGSGSRGRGRAIRTMNIAEQVDVGVPVRLAYDLWTRFQDFSQFMKKVRTVERISDEMSNWKVQFFWSHRAWEATIIEQVPDERIVWRSTGAKGYVNGAVSFHALASNMTRILLALEYHPHGLLDRTGSLWRAHSRRARLEIAQFRHYVMTRAVLDPNSVRGWRGEIRDGEVVRTHEEAVAAQAQERTENTDVRHAPFADGDYQDRIRDSAATDAGERSDTDDAAGEHEDHDDPNDSYDRADDIYDEPADTYDDADDRYDDEPGRAPLRPGRR